MFLFTLHPPPSRRLLGLRVEAHNEQGSPLREDATLRRFCLGDSPSMLLTEPTRALDMSTATLAGLRAYPITNSGSSAELTCECSDPTATLIAEFEESI